MDHIIHLFKVDNLMVFSILTNVQASPQFILEYFHQLQKKPLLATISNPPAPTKFLSSHQHTICLHTFAYSGIL